MKVEVYGSNHSPWVQAVLLALHEKGIDHALHQLPPLEAFKQWGVLMPAVSIDGEPWEIESTQILVKLGLGPISDDDLQAVQDAWQGVQHRPDNPFQYFSAFARDGDTSPSFFKRSAINFARSFSGRYFEPHLPPPAATGPAQRAFFYLGLLAMFLAFPLTLPLALVLISTVPR